MTTPPPVTPTRRTYALAALGFAAFIVYGSLIPFNFHPRPWPEVVDAYAWAITNRVAIESRSDVIANILIAVPLGFTLLGAFRLDRPGGRPDLLTGLACLPPCVGLAAAVEFGQLYLPSRTCSGQDIWCQGLGAALGMAVWIAAGRTLTAHARVVWGRTNSAGIAGRMLIAYLALLAFIQMLPLDLNPSPAGLYRKFRDGGVRGVPFVEFHGVTSVRIWGWLSGSGHHSAPPPTVDESSEATWKEVGKLVQVFGLYLPAGLLAGQLPGRFWGRITRVATAGILLAGAMETLQLPVTSRTPRSTDALIGAAGLVTGWGIGRRWGNGMRAELAFVFAQLWFAALLVVYWQPFEFRDQSAAFDWIPGLPLESGDPLFTLEELLTKPLLFAPIGVLVGVVGVSSSGRSSLIRAAIVGMGVSAAIEVGQLFLTSHTPCVTDGLLGGFGGVVGAWSVARMSGSREGNVRPGMY